MEEEFKRLAALFISTMSQAAGVELKLDEPSIEWADGFIERQRTLHGEDENRGMSNVIGSFLGECIIANYGGSWRSDGQNWGVYFDDSNAVFPFSKAQKQLAGGHEDGESIHSFFTMIPLVFNLKKDAQ
jgi:hypothetical protein